MFLDGNLWSLPPADVRNYAIFSEYPPIKWLPNLSSANSLHLIMFGSSAHLLNPTFSSRGLAGGRCWKANFDETSCRNGTSGGNNRRLRRESWSWRFLYRILFYCRPFFILILLVACACPLICDTRVPIDVDLSWYLRVDSSWHWKLNQHSHSSSSNVLWLTLFISINKYIQNNDDSHSLLFK